MTNGKIGLREIRNLQQGETIWDTTLPGFGARRQKGVAVTFILKYRTKEGRQRWFSIGRWGAPWTPDMARAEAYALLGRVVRNDDPATEKSAARSAATVAELCDQYLSDAQAGRLLTRRKIAKALSTLATDKGRIDGHIKPLLGNMSVASVTHRDIDKFMHDVAAGKTARVGSTSLRKKTRIAGGKGAAARTVGLLGSIFVYAVRQGLRSDNPVRGVVRFADGARDRRLTDDEYLALGTGLRAACDSSTIWPPAIAATRFLALTGWRSGEALNLRWEAIDFQRRTAILANTKTGRSMRPLSRAACDLLAELPQGGTFVFPATRGERGLTGFPQVWTRKIVPQCGLPREVTPHTLRHSFASLANDLGYSEATIAALIGHKGRSMTSRYVHAADAVLLAAADAVANETAFRMGDQRSAKVIRMLGVHS